uniref:Probable U2 small nuclear ribonucleoprotein A' n=1 Tax=Panagrellus redivivus TaxID=6233 RepID=A0A7E4ZUW0_PANRE
MVRLTVETIEAAREYLNTCKQRELGLRNMQIPAIENLGVTKDRFDVLDLTDNNIRKLENFPVLRRLEVLLLHNNRIQQIQKHIGRQLPSLKTLVLTNNNLQELGDIDVLESCPNLEYLTLQGNPLTHKPHYRAYIIYKLKSVRVLDFRRVKLSERQEADKLFKGKKGAALRTKLIKKSDRLPDEDESEKAAQARQLPTEEQEKIKAAIANTKSLEEIELLQQMLTTGKIPDSNWNNPGGKKPNNATEAENPQAEIENVDVEMTEG